MNNNIISTKEATTIIKVALSVTKVNYSKSARKGGMLFHALKTPVLTDSIEKVTGLITEGKVNGWILFTSKDGSTTGLFRICSEQIVETVGTPPVHEEVNEEPIEVINEQPTFTMEEIAGADEVTTSDEANEIEVIGEVVETKAEKKARMKKEKAEAKKLEEEQVKLEEVGV